jgi:hypothetical protein
MRRSAAVTTGAAVLLALALPLPAAQAAGSGATATGYREPLCQQHTSMCLDVYDNPAGEYVGHDEPSLAFRSGVPGSGNDMTYVLTLPKDPKTQPTASGAGGSTWNFQLRPTFWFGMTLCDTESAPEFTKSCAADSDSNNLVGTDPNAPDYIGKHPGNAFMELQFYAPGWVPQFEGFGCTATQYCAAMTIDSLSLNQNTNVANTTACDNYLLGGIEPINWAYVTRSGRSQAPADPLFTGTFDNPDLTAVTPDLGKVLLMNPGDRIRVHLHDTAEGLRVDMTDLTTEQRGSMTASIANGFAHVRYQPGSATCQSAPYAFHPEYATANPRGNTWSAHTTNISYSDEIGHFENCLQLDGQGGCTTPGSPDAATGPDPDDVGCLPADHSSLVKINGCVGSDSDWDGQSYRNDWPGTDPNVRRDRALHPTPVAFTSPLIKGRINYSTIQFETDLPRIEAADSQDNSPFCNRTTGADCVNPPTGAQFYPIFTTAQRDGQCLWQEGGPYLPGTTNTFGGNSAAEFGPLLKTVYPSVGGPVTRINNFNSGDLRNPCKVSRD